MKTHLYLAILLIASIFPATGQEADIPRPAPHQLKWHESEMGVVFHYDLHVFDGIKYGQGNNRVQPIEDYNIFNPTQLNTDQWVQAAKAAGAKFAVLTATHETGFAIYQSDVNPYCLKGLLRRMSSRSTELHRNSSLDSLDKLSCRCDSSNLIPHAYYVLSDILGKLILAIVLDNMK